MIPRRLLVLVSGSGTLLQALIDACADPSYGIVIAAVGADRDGIEGLERARRAGLDTFVLPPAEFPDRSAWDVALAERIRAALPEAGPRWVVSAGFMRILGPAVLAQATVVNTHPALLPSFPGAHGVRDALAHGVRVTGSTVHLVEEGVDTGPILAQRSVPVRATDTEETLHARIKVVERDLLVRTVRDLLTRDTHPTDREAPPAVTTTDERRPVRRALISVYDKTGLAELARGLHTAGVSLVSTGSTATHIADAGVPVTPVEEVTGFPECLDGRVKTLHPRVHAGLLADSTNPEHVAALADLDIEAFDLVVVNLYPFAETVAAGADEQACVEQIDIGGPTMVRAAAKNHRSVAVVVDPGAYQDVVTTVAAGGFDLAQRRALAARAFTHTATYDVQVASWMGSVLTDTSDGTGFPRWVGATWDRAQVLRYGENPHQGAALYTAGHAGQPGLAQATQLHGKAMSYNNWIDADAARRAAHDHGDRPTVAIIKHANPCGIAVGDDIAAAHRAAHACDPVSAYGGIVATNRPVSAEMAHALADVFTEVVVAPAFEPEALDLLRRRKNLRLLQAAAPARGGVEMRPVSGGLLLQHSDAVDAVVEDGGDDPRRWRLCTGTAVDEATREDLAFAWRSVRAVKSNAILLAHDGASVGIGMGQVNRVDSCHLAVQRAGARAAGSVAASDAFFPFADGLQVLLDAGVRAVVAPGGSIRDEEVVAAAEAAGVTLYFTGTRHFAH